MTSKQTESKQEKLAQALEQAAKELRKEETVVQLTLPIKLPPAGELWLLPADTRLTVEMAAAALGLTRHSIYALVARGALPKTKLLGKLVFKVSELRQFIAQYEIRG